MSPLVFLAIAVVVPLLGMVVLGIGARRKRKRVTDDETEPFRRRLDSLAPEAISHPRLPPADRPPLVSSIRLIDRSPLAQNGLDGPAAPASPRQRPAPASPRQRPAPASPRQPNRAVTPRDQGRRSGS